MKAKTALLQQLGEIHVNNVKEMTENFRNLVVLTFDHMP